MLAISSHSFDIGLSIVSVCIPEMSASSSNSNEYNLQQNLDDEGMGDGHNDHTNGERSVAQCSTASTPKDIKFNIHHKYTTHNVVVSDRSTIGKLLLIKSSINRSSSKFACLLQAI